ncbi:hypothetical protein [Thaumasiovibrio subtropicus]|uniref:hypothetical protein n=1 Tax=Thaumasiovibrio subtropicus TaxID=1891207 RepID=UPI000B35CC66|nr:hypothetical protein [Thaumasiovibrio subtropicus]
MEKERIAIGISNGMNISTTPVGLIIERKWFSSNTLFLTVFTIAWYGFLLNWYTNIPNIWPINAENMMAALFPLIHVSVGISLTYYVIASYFNKTTVTVSPSVVESRITPIPFGFKKSITSKSIEQVYCKEVTTEGRNRKHVSYEVRVVLKDQRHIGLVSGFESSEQALFLQQEIEAYLGIKDVSVKGELA